MLKSTNYFYLPKMFRRTNVVLLKVLLLVFSVGYSGEEVYKNCSSFADCVSISSCDTLIYNFTSLSDNDRRQALQSIHCGGSESDPLICCGSCGPIAFDDKIIGGSDASIHEYPWMAALKYEKDGRLPQIACGGSLINQRYVLTAAHCLTQEWKLGKLIQVVLAEYHLLNTTDCVGEVCVNASHIDIEKMIFHKNYSSETNENDIGLIRLKDNIEYSEFIRPICLPTTVGLVPSKPPDMLEISGWGETLRARLSQIKQSLFVPVYDFTECKNKYSKLPNSNINLSESQLCAGGRNREDACKGDSGGALMKVFNKSDKRYVIEGVLSFGHSLCTEEGWPSVYSRVSSFESWIREHVQP